VIRRDPERARAFSRRLRRLMSARGLTPKGVAIAMGGTEMDAANVRAWMCGRCSPSMASLHALKAALRCTWEELLGDE